MSKLILSDVPNGVSNTVTNTNFKKIENELNNNVLKRRTEVGEDNTIHTDLDMNSNRIYNLPEPVLDHEPARKRDIAMVEGYAADAEESASKAKQSAIEAEASAASVQIKEQEREKIFKESQEERENRFNDFIASSGFQFLGDYAAGIEITEYNQIVRDSNGEFWRLSGEVELPYTTTGAGLPEDDSLTPVGDAVLRQDLSRGANELGGAVLVSDTIVCVSSVQEMLNLNLEVGRRIQTGGTIWRRDRLTTGGITDYEPLSDICANDFGADPTFTVDSYAAIQAALDASYNRRVYLKNGKYLSTQTLKAPRCEFVNGDRFNSISVHIESPVVPVLMAENVNSITIGGLNLTTTAELSDETPPILELTGCTYYTLKYIRVSATLNGPENRVGKGVVVKGAGGYFSGYGEIVGVAAPYFGVGMESNNTLASISRCSLNYNRIGLVLRGETVSLSDNDIAANSEWGIDSHLSLSLVESNTYSERVFMDTHLKLSVKPVMGVTSLGGKREIRRGAGTSIYVNKGDTEGVNLGIPISNDGFFEASNFAPDPNMIHGLAMMGWTPASGVTEDVLDKPLGCAASVVLDPSNNGAIKDRRIDSVSVPAATSISTSFYIKRIGGSPQDRFVFRVSQGTEDVTKSGIFVNILNSMLEEDTWTQITATAKNEDKEALTLNYLRYYVTGSTIWKVARHVVTTGGHVISASSTPFTKEWGGTIYSNDIALPNLPTTQPGKVGALWNDNGVLKIVQ